MPSNKDRLYVALYARAGGPKMPGGEDKYHWALIVGAKDEGKNDRGKRFHAKERLVGPGQSQWEFEERDIPISPTNMLLVRVMVAKILDTKRLMETLRSIPVRPDLEGWNCVAWVKEALDTLTADGKTLGTSVTDWETVSNAAMEYVEKKIAEHRFDRQAEVDTQRVPTFDLIEGTETIP